MIKKIIIGIVLVIIAILGWHFISPFFINVQIQEELPEEFLVSENILIEREQVVPQAILQVETRDSSNEQIVEVEQDHPNQDMPQEPVVQSPKITHQSNFEKVDYNVSGSYKIIENNGSSLLRIENLDITNGPDLHFVLSNSKQSFGNGNFETIAELPANQGSYNIPIPDTIDPEDYQYLLIHCVQYSHTFASASLI